MSLLPPSSEQISFCGSRARSWLLGLNKLIGVDTSISIASILQILVGCWICENALVRDGEQTGVQSLARELHRRLNDGGQEVFSGLLNCDAALILLSAGILRTLNIRNDAIEFFIQKVKVTLQAYKDQDQIEASELFVTRFLLHNLDSHPSLDTYVVNLPHNALETKLFQADELIIRSLAADIAAATAYGKKLPSADPELLGRLVVVLPVWMLYYLRQHNLEIGTLLLRTMNYLHLRDDFAFQMSLNFILAQQQLDGRFGFFAPEISQLQSFKPHFDNIFALYLPITLSCLWAIAETTNPHFILFSSI